MTTLFKIYNIVRHANGGEYGIMRTPEEATYEPTGEPCYIYIDKDMKIWVRPQEQMEDGRFTLIGSIK